jgi:hypothetical protein
LAFAGTGLADVDQGFAPSGLSAAHFGLCDALVDDHGGRSGAGQTHKRQRGCDQAERFHGEFPIMEGLKGFYDYPNLFGCRNELKMMQMKPD